MSYVTYDEFIIRYPSLSTSSQDNIEDDLLAYAEVEINGRFASHFSVPFSANHPTVKDLTMDLAYYRQIRLKDPEKAEKIRKDVIGRIDDIKAGKEFIYTGSGTLEFDGSAAIGVDVWSTVENYHPVHSMLDPEDPLTEIDSSQLYDEADERA